MQSLELSYLLSVFNIVPGEVGDGGMVLSVVTPVCNFSDDLLGCV
jgi:hypothetical protein